MFTIKCIYLSEGPISHYLRVSINILEKWKILISWKTVRVKRFQFQRKKQNMLIMEISWSKLGSLAGWLWHKPQFSNHCLRQKCQSWAKSPRLGCLTWHVYSSWKPNKPFQLSRVFSIHFLFFKTASQLFLVILLQKNTTVYIQIHIHTQICIQMSTKCNNYVYICTRIKPIRFLTSEW